MLLELEHRSSATPSYPEAALVSAFDPKRTFGGDDRCDTRRPSNPIPPSLNPCC